MVEFGAGGTLQQATAEVTPVAPAVPTTAGADDTPNAEDAEAPQLEAGQAAAPTDAEPSTPAAPAASAPAPAAPRRKRKPKGWFCPVCRQPYTSLLRITTTPPDLKPSRDSEDGDAADAAAMAPAVPEPAATGGQRPGFLRSISRALTSQATAPVPTPGTPSAEVGTAVV